MNQNIYVISGLGADHTVFSKLILPGYNLVHIVWVTPQKSDSMSDYAQRLLPQIKDETPIVLGLSLGGMLALEVAKLIPVSRVISLSSIINRKELPWYFKLGGVLRLQKILPLHLFAKGNRLTHWFFGARKPTDKLILNDVFKNMDKVFLYWALNAVITWENNEFPTNIRRIHGSGDRVLPLRKNVAYNEVVSGGSHLMLMDQHEEVAERLLRQLIP